MWKDITVRNSTLASTFTYLTVVVVTHFHLWTQMVLVMVGQVHQVQYEFLPRWCVTSCNDMHLQDPRTGGHSKHTKY